ncbi:MAG: YegS/Rv2252/BmrU family lipid kinase [Oscillospiraceae bacterium]|nr:YegS/Rv2252/BmrU family lipid kinase [Oscillospiraceae bacterium]
MTHLFLINPAAGKYDHTFDFSEKIHGVCKARGLSYRIRVSKKPGDITAYAREAGQSGEETRIYACGGDGTLNEAVNGAFGYSNLAVTHYPGGSGNDFTKMFSDPSRFYDLDALLEGEEAAFDLIECGDSYALNICSMGFDARVGTEVAKYKHLPGVGGHGAYLISTVSNLLRGIHEPYVIELNGERIEGEKSMICICSGRFYGGGFNPVPEAEPDDGLLDLLLVAPVSRLQVAQIIGPFKAGRHKEYPALFRHCRSTEITVHCRKEAVINLDGEARYGTDVTFRVVPGGIRFFYPRGLTYHANL